jgi:hypothetical protein
VVTDTFTGLQWEQDSSISTYNWIDADAYCKSRITGGYKDWNLPDMFKLQSLVDYTIDYHGPTINTTVFPGTPNQAFWSSTPVVGSAINSWYVSFGTDVSSYWGGEGYHAASTYAYNVRCVRCNNAIMVNRYNATNDTITDNLTGLEWEKNVSGIYVWADVLTYCSNQNTGGKSGWRVPTIKELSTLANHQIVGGLAMDPVFSGAPAVFYWSSTYVSGSIGGYWRVAFYDGHTGHGSQNETNMIRCVCDSS